MKTMMTKLFNAEGGGGSTGQPFGGGAGEPAAGGGAEAQGHPIHNMNADAAKAFVAEQALEDLDAVEVAELANPKNTGGRKSVLAAISDRRAKLTAPPAPPAEQPQAAAEDASQATIEIVAEATGNQSNQAIDLLLAACELFGVHPGVNQRPRELASWRFYQGSRVDGQPDAVVIVTMGGRKLKHYADPTFPMDPETEEILRMLFNAWGADPVTKQPVAKPLPGKLLLPDAAVTGKVPDGADKRYRYEGGYLRNGGKVEAAKRGRI